MRFNSIKKCLPGFAIAFLFISCVTMADYNFKRIDKAIYNSDFATVYDELEHPNGVLYSVNDKALKELDMGLISHYAGEYKRSNEELAKAEKLIESYYAKSVTQAIGSFLVNDTVVDYSGDPYEDIYTNIFMAMNYLKMNDFDEAFVEIRRFDNKMKVIQHKYQPFLEQQKENLKQNQKAVPKVDVKFHNSALARYLSMLLYRADGDYDSAKVDRNMIHQAFMLQSDIYNFKEPAFLDEELVRPDFESGRLNLVSFTGFAPEKIEEVTPLFVTEGFYRIALPVMQKRGSVVTDVLLKAVNVETGESFSTKAEKIESIENIAIDTYSEKYASIVGRTVARMVSKLAATAVLDGVSENIDNQALSLLFAVAGAASKVNMFLSERADVRTSRYFPGSAYASGVTVPTGKYDVTVIYKNGKSVLSEEKFSNLEVKNSSLNLVESFCLR